MNFIFKNLLIFLCAFTIIMIYGIMFLLITSAIIVNMTYAHATTIFYSLALFMLIPSYLHLNIVIKYLDKK